MFTITFFILTFIITYFCYRLISGKTLEFIPNKMNELSTTAITIRMFYYLFLTALIVIIPHLLTMIFIMATGDRIEGMQAAVIPGLLIPHLIFGYFFIKNKKLIKVLRSLLLSIIATVFVIVFIRYDLIETNWDIYGYWDLIVSNFIVGLVFWETYYQIMRKIKSIRSKQG